MKKKAPETIVSEVQTETPNTTVTFTPEPQEPQEPKEPKEPQEQTELFVFEDEPEEKVNVEQEAPQEPKKRKYNKTGKYKKENVINVTEGNSSSDEFFNEYTQTEQGKESNNSEQAKEKERQFSNFVSGYLFLLCIDTLLPELLIFLFSRYDKKFREVDKKDLKLTADEKKELEPLADEVVKELFGTMSPVSQFIFTISFLYSGKLAIARASL